MECLEMSEEFGASRVALGTAGPRRRLLWRLLPVLVIVQASRAGARELHWRELSVRARLDAEGQLHVSERHQMVFTGEWNGGERGFKVAKEQHFELGSLTRIAAGGAQTKLVEGDLTDVDQYTLADELTLRWRSRLPTDAPFDHTEIGYVIDYVLSDILVPTGPGQFTLDHEFAFLERSGDIEHFRLQLELDPVWGTTVGLPVIREAGPLHPYVGFVLTLPLESRGAAYPRSFWKRTWRSLRSVDPGNWALAALFGALMVRWLGRRLRLERERGLFAPIPAASEIDRSWIEALLLPLKPELVGVARDLRVGSSDVAALLARLVQEGKIASVLRGSPAGGAETDFELELLVSRNSLSGYERELIKLLFFKGPRTSSQAIQKHYARSGFYPASSLRQPLSDSLGSMLGPGKYGAPIGSRVFPMVALGMFTFMIALGCSVLYTSEVNGSVGVAAGSALAGAAFYALGIQLAVRVYGNVAGPRGPWRWHGAWFALWTALVIVLFVGMAPSGLVAVLILFFGLAVARCMLWVSSSPENAAGIALRKRLVAARRYLVAELEKPEPQLDDAWFPYLVALGLSPHVDQWLRGFGGDAARSRPSSSSESDHASSNDGWSSSSERSSAPGRWTGGGGSFGGAGASGSWLSAAESLTAGVARPSSSSSGSSSSSSSSSSSGSSGGGSGGGW